MFWRTWLDRSPNKEIDEMLDKAGAYLGIRTKILGIRPVAVFLGHRIDEFGRYYVGPIEISEAEATNFLAITSKQPQKKQTEIEEKLGDKIARARETVKRFDLLKTKTAINMR